jgi:3-phosphoglycerate kinase
MVAFRLVDLLVESVSHLDNLRSNSGASKEDVCDEMRERFAKILSAVVAVPVTNAFALPHCDVDVTQNNNQLVNEYVERMQASKIFTTA